MATIKLQTKYDKERMKRLKKMIEGIPDAMKPQDAEALGAWVEATMKDMIKKGLSPIEGNGRFPAYKEHYPKDVQSKYPGKKPRPVNLYLSGDFMRYLTFKIYRAKYGSGIEVGYYDSESEKKEEGHRKGTNNQAIRPSIPSPTERFAAKIMRGINKVFLGVLKNHLKKSA